MTRIVPLGGLSAALGCLLLCSCTPDQSSLMPLSKGGKWSYQLEEAGTLYALFEVKGPAYVGREKGWVLTSELGESRMGWWNGMLRASMLSGAVYDPPLPLLIPAKALPAPPKSKSGRPSPILRPSAAPIRWKGKMMNGGQWQDATAELVQQWTASDDPDLAFAKTGGDGLRAFLTLKVGGQEIETQTLYREGIGIVRQLIKRPDRPPMNLIYSSGGAVARDGG